MATHSSLYGAPIRCEVGHLADTEKRNWRGKCRNSAHMALLDPRRGNEFRCSEIDRTAKGLHRSSQCLQLPEVKTSEVGAGIARIPPDSTGGAASLSVFWWLVADLRKDPDREPSLIAVDFRQLTCRLQSGSPRVFHGLSAWRNGTGGRLGCPSAAVAQEQVGEIDQLSHDRDNGDMYFSAQAVS